MAWPGVEPLNPPVLSQPATLTHHWPFRTLVWPLVRGASPRIFATPRHRRCLRAPRWPRAQPGTPRPATGIRTEAGYQLYERFVKGQSKGNKVKVAPKKIAVAWNAEVDRLIVAADSDSVRYVQMCTWIIHTILTYLNRPCPAAP